MQTRSGAGATVVDGDFDELALDAVVVENVEGFVLVEEDLFLFLDMTFPSETRGM